MSLLVCSSSSFSAYGDDANLGGRGEGGGNLRVARVGVGGRRSS